jgi:hypothetical protein
VIRTALALGIATAVAACAACRTGAAPPAIAAELVEAGCEVPSATLSTSVQTELASDAAPGWLRCLAAGGSVAACGAPCGLDGGSSH